MSIWMNPPEFESASVIKRSSPIGSSSSFSISTSASVQSPQSTPGSISVCLQFCPLAIHSYCCLGLVYWQFFTDSCVAHKTLSDAPIVFITHSPIFNWHAITDLFGVLEQIVLFFMILGLKSVFSMLSLLHLPPHTPCKLT